MARSIAVFTSSVMPARIAGIQADLGSGNPCRNDEFVPQC
jgi:hypothetical protein